MLGVALGAVMIALGQKEAGIGIVVTGAGALIAGYQLPIGETVHPEIPRVGSDGLVDPEVMAQITGTPAAVAAPVTTTVLDMGERAVEQAGSVVAMVSSVLGMIKPKT